MPMELLPTRDDLAAELKVFIPKVGRWKHDSSCGICGVEFNYIRGRHHCRYCGVSVCGKHSRNRAVVPSSMSTEKQRVCDQCYPKCQYGIPLQRRRGYTTSSHGGADFTLLDVCDSQDPRQLKAERSRARTMLNAGPSHSSSRSRSPGSVISSSSHDTTWNTAQTWREEQKAMAMAPRARRVSDPPERMAKNRPATPPLKKKMPPSPPPSPPLPLSPMTRQSISAGVFQMNPRKPKRLDSPYGRMSKKKSSKTLSINKQYSSPPPPPAKKPFNIPTHHPLDASFAMSDFMSSFASVRNTKEEDDIAMQYLASFMKSENTSVQETNHVTVSHSNSGPLIGMATVVEMKPASPKHLELSMSMTPPQSESRFQTVGAESQNRKFSTSSTGTISASDSEGQNEEKHLSTVPRDSDDERVKRVRSHFASPGALTVEVNSFGRWKSTKDQSPAKAKSARAKLSSSVTFAKDSKPCDPEPSEEGIQLMHEIMDLEKQIHQYQCELPTLIEEWKHVEHRAAMLRADARESREKVLQYQKARALVSRAIRVGTKCLQDKEYEAAVLELSRAAAIERTNAKVWYLLAESRMKLGQLAEAEEACLVSVELQHSAVGIALLGRILHARGRHDEAIECYLTALGRSVEI